MAYTDMGGGGALRGGRSGRSSSDTRRHRRFHRPVIVQTGRIDRERVVGDTRAAAEVLLRDWPNEGSRRERAMQAVLEVIRGEKPPSHARNAFIAAAKEARVLLDE